MLESETIARLHPPGVRQKYPNNAVLQSEQERVIVLQLLRMLNASQQLNDEKANGKRQVRKVMRMLNRERKIQSDLHAVNDQMTKELRERTEREDKKIVESSERRIKEIDLICQEYLQQNLQLQQKLSRLRQARLDDTTAWKHQEIQKSEDFAKERIKMKKEIRKLQDLHKHERDRLKIDIGLLAGTTKNQQSGSILPDSYRESGAWESSTGMEWRKMWSEDQVHSSTSKKGSANTESSIGFRKLEENKALQNQVNEAQQNYSALLKEMEYLQNVYDQTTKDHRRTKTSFEERQQKLEEELAHMHQADMEHQDEMKGHIAHVALVERERDAVIAAQIGLSQRLQESESTCTRLKDELTGLATERDQTEERNVELTAVRQSLETEKQKLAEELAQMQALFKRLRGNSVRLGLAKPDVVSQDHVGSMRSVLPLTRIFSHKGSSHMTLGSSVKNSVVSNIARKRIIERIEASGSRDIVAHTLDQTTTAGATEVSPDHDSSDEVGQQGGFVQDKAVFDGGVDIESSQSSGEKYLQTTPKMDTLAREMEGEGGVKISNENLEIDELRMQCHFLEHDRSELARVTNEILAMERESHTLEVEAAVASARRQSMEDFQVFQQKTHQQMKNLYKSLCESCRNRIDKA
ncbi:MAG: hypothetical protein SGBAC_000306 [Bacillariaceae sp.]